MILASLFCVIVLAGGYAYSGQILPIPPQNSDAFGIILFYISRSFYYIIPILTAFLLIKKIIYKKK